MIRSFFLLSFLLFICLSLTGQEAAEIIWKISRTHSLKIEKPEDPVSKVRTVLYQSNDSLDIKRIQLPLQKGHLYVFTINNQAHEGYWIYTGLKKNTLHDGSVFYPYRWLRAEEKMSINDSLDQFEVHLKPLKSKYRRTSLGDILHNFRDKKRLLRIYRDEYIRAFHDSSISDLFRYYQCMRYVEELIYSPEYIPSDLSPSPVIAAGEAFESAHDFFLYQYVWKLAQLEWSRDVLSKDRTALSDPDPDFNALFRSFPAFHFEDSILARTCMVYAMLKNRRYLEKGHFMEELKRLENQSTYPATTRIIRNLIKDEFYLKEGSDVSGIRIPDAQGDSILLSDLNGQPVLLDFWATWCRPCRKEDPHLQALEKEFPSLKVLKISINSNEEAVAHYFKKRGIEGPNYVSNEHLNELFGVYGLPTYVLIDKKSIVRANPAPMPSDPAFRTLLEKVLNE